MSTRAFALLQRTSAAILLIAGCATLSPPPNIHPFATGTARMSEAIATGVGHAHSLLEGVDEQRSRELARAWKATRGSMAALTAYSEALVEVSAAGTEGKEAAKAVADALGGVLTVVGAGPIPAGLAKGFSEALGLLVRIRAKAAMSDAVATAQPVVDTISAIIAANLADLAQITAAAGAEALNRHVAGHRATVNYVEALYREDARILEILTLILEYQTGRTDALSVLSTKDPLLAGIQQKPEAAQTKEIEARQEYWTKRSRTVQGEAARYAQAYGDYRRTADDLVARTGRTTTLLHTATTAVNRWAQAHGRLYDALAANRPLTIVDFTSAVDAMYAVLEAGGTP